MISSTTGDYPPRTRLFLDDLHIGSMSNVQRKLGRPKAMSDLPVLAPDRPWEGIAIVSRNGIIYDCDDRCFKCWYACHDPTLPDSAVKSKRRWCYATSADGMQWQRPSLGLVDYMGSRQNNLLHFQNIGENVALLWNVAKDNREADESKRYKSIGLDRHALRAGEMPWTGPDGPDGWYEHMGRHIGCGLFIGYSADGLSWRISEAGCAGSGSLLMDGSTLHGYDDRIRQWVLWQRPRIMPKYRTIGVSFSDDFESWTFPEIGIAPDEQDPPGMQFDQFSSMQSPDGGYIGLLSTSGWTGSGFDAGEELPQLAYSRDARVWTRCCREPFLRAAGAAPSWDDGCVIPFNPIPVGDEVFIFYYGKNAGRMWGEPTLDGKRTTTSAIGLAKLRRDRWMSISANGRHGELTTPLICFAHNELHVNVDASAGELAVELVDCQTHQPVRGYSLTECDAIRADVLDHRVSWRGKADLSPLIGTATRQPRVGRGMIIRFRLDHAHLYSFSC